MTQLGGVITPQDNMVLAMRGEVFQGGVSIVEFLAEAFHQTNDVVVAPVHTITKVFIQDLYLHLIGPFVNGTPGTETV